MENFEELRKVVEKIDVAGKIDNVLNYKTAYNRLFDTVNEMPNSVALNYMGRKITYKQFLNIVDAAANGFAELGIGYNDVVTMSVLPTPYGIASFYALDKLGAISHMVNSLTNSNEIRRELSNFNSKYFLGNDLFCSAEKQKVYKSSGVEKIITISLTDSLPKALSLDKILFIIAEKKKGLSKKNYDNKTLIDFKYVLDLGKKRKHIEPCKYQDNKIASISYTSGSTGNSKACVATWKSIDAMVQVMGMTEVGRFEKGDRLLSAFPLWINYSLLNMIHEPLSLGVTLILDPLFKPENIIKRNNKYKLNHILSTPPYVKKITELNKKTDFSQLKIFITGGDTLPNDVKIKADKYIKKNGGTAQIVQGYGATECLGSFSYCYYPDSTLGSVGKPCIGNLIKIIDQDTGEELGVGETGVGYFYSPALMKEYYGDEAATQKNLIPDENGVLWYNTEDLLHVNEKGEIFLDGRIRRIVLTYDENGNPTKIIPDKLKNVLLNRADIEKCEVITVPDDVKVNVSIAFVVPKDKNLKSDEFRSELIDYSKENVPEYMIPKDIVFIDDIPVTSSSKPDLKTLEKMYMARN